MQTGSLYEISVASGLQAATGVSGFLAKGLEHCRTSGMDPQMIVSKRLHPDMLPFHYQIVCVAAYSAGAIDAARSGAFPPPGPSEGYDYQGLQDLVDRTLVTLRGLSEAEVNSITTPVIAFKHPAGDMPFALRDFFLSFVLPNLYFHATTAYGLLRAIGVPLGKLDFIGPMRFVSR